MHIYQKYIREGAVLQVMLSAFSSDFSSSLFLQYFLVNYFHHMAAKRNSESLTVHGNSCD